MVVAHVTRLPHGELVSMKLDQPFGMLDVRQAWRGAVLERSDGARWPIFGVETFAKLGAPDYGEGIGLLLNIGAQVKVGDVVKVDTDRCADRAAGGRWCDRKAGHYPATLHGQYAEGDWYSREDEDERLRGLQ